MRQFLDLLKSSDSWRIRVEILLPLQSASPILQSSIGVLTSSLAVFYFHNLFNLDQEIVAELMDAICGLLRDPKVLLSLSYSGSPTDARVADRSKRSGRDDTFRNCSMFSTKLDLDATGSIHGRHSND